MADLEISNLPAVTVPLPVDELAIVNDGVTKKITRAQMHTLGLGEFLSLPNGGDASLPEIRFPNSGLYEDLNDELAVSQGGTKVANFTSALSGGLFIDNQLTGAGLERVLTTSDAANFGEYRGEFDASLGSFPSTLNQGDWFNCVTPGTVDGQAFVLGDILVALIDNPSTVTFAANWSIVPHIGQADHLLLSNIGVNTHAQIDAHIADASIHFTEASIDHTAILNVGTNTHAQIDTALATAAAHIADGSIHFTQAAISITESQISDLQNYSLVGHTHDAADVVSGVFAAARLSPTNHTVAPASNLSEYVRFGTSFDLDDLREPGQYGIGSSNVNTPVGATFDPMFVLANASDISSQLVVPRTASRGLAWRAETSDVFTAWHYAGWTVTPANAPLDQYASHIADSSIHFTEGSITITESQISDLGDYLTANAADTKTAGILRFNDGIALTFGNTDDGTINWDGTNLRFDVSSGEIRFEGGNIRTRSGAGLILNTTDNAAVGLTIATPATVAAPVSFSTSALRFDLLDDVRVQGSISATTSAPDTGINEQIGFIDVNGGVARFGSYNWSLGAWQPAAFQGSTVSIAAQSGSLTLSSSGGDIILSNTIQLPTGGTQSAPTLTWTGDSNTGFYRNAADAISITAGANRQMLINTVGVQIDESLFISEKAAPAASSAGLGQFWVENTAPNRPMFTDDTGVTFDLTAGGVTPPIDLADSEQVRWGTGNDFTIDFDGTFTNFTTPAASALRIQGGAFVDLRNGMDLRWFDVANTASVQASMSSATELFFEGSGSQFVVMDGVDLRMRDGRSINFGTGDDIQVESPDGINLNWTGVSGANLNFTFAGASIFNVDMAVLRISSAGELQHVHGTANSTVGWEWNGATAFETVFGSNVASWAIQGMTATDVIQIQDGPFVRFFDPTDAVYHQFQRLAGRFRISGTGTDFVEWDSTAGPLRFDDNTEVQFGNGADSEIYSNGTDTFWDSISGSDITIRHITENFIQCLANSSVTLYFNGSDTFRTASFSATGQTSGAEVNDNNDVFHDVGFNDLRIFNDNVSDTLEANHAGQLAFKDAATARTLTLASNVDLDFPVETLTTVINAFTSGNYTITEGASTTLYYLDGATRIDTAGGCTVGPGGVANIWRESATVYYIWGTGITP